MDLLTVSAICTLSMLRWPARRIRILEAVHRKLVELIPRRVVAALRRHGVSFERAEFFETPSRSR